MISTWLHAFLAVQASADVDILPVYWSLLETLGDRGFWKLVGRAELRAFGRVRGG